MIGSVYHITLEDMTATFDTTATVLACVTSVPVPRERSWGRVKEFFRIRAARKMRREQKSGRRGVGRREKEGTLARKPLDFEKRPLVFTVEFIY